MIDKKTSQELVDAINQFRDKAQTRGLSDIVKLCDESMADIVAGDIEAAADKVDKINHEIETRSANEPLNRKFRPPMSEGDPNAWLTQGQNKVINQADFDKIVRKAGLPKPEDLSYVDLSLWAAICQTMDWAKHDSYEQRLEALCQQKFGASFRTMTSGGSGTGQELLDEAVRDMLFNDVVLGANVARLFEIVSMPANPYDLPVIGDVTFYTPGGEGEAVTASDLATAKRTLTAYTIKAQVDISDELEQDSVIALIPQIRSKLVENASREMDKLILLADTETGATGNINSDDAAPTAGSDYLLGFDGIVKYALVTNTGQKSDLATLEIADFGTLLGLLDGKYIVDPSRLAWISDPWTYATALQLSDFRTVDKLGNRATLVSGQLGAVYGIPYIATDAMGKVDDDGKYTTTNPATNDTDGRLILVHCDMWKVGVRQPVRVATERSEAKGITSIVVSFRLALVSFNASGKYTSIGYNITV